MFVSGIWVTEKRGRLLAACCLEKTSTVGQLTDADHEGVVVLDSGVVKHKVIAGLVSKACGKDFLVFRRRKRYIPGSR